MIVREIRKTAVGNKLYLVWGGFRRTRVPEWDRFEPFYRWAIARGFTADHYISRPRKDEPFGPDNCEIRLARADNGMSSIAQARAWDRTAAKLWALIGQPDPREYERLRGEGMGE